MKRLITGLAVLIAVPAGCAVASKIRDQRILAANPIQMRCHVVGKARKDGYGNLVDIPVSVSITNRSGKPIDRVEVMYYTDISGTQHLTYGALAAHASQTRNVPLQTIAEDRGVLKCEDYIVLYSDGARWNSPFKGPYWP